MFWFGFETKKPIPISPLFLFSFSPAPSRQSIHSRKTTGANSTSRMKNSHVSPLDHGVCVRLKAGVSQHMRQTRLEINVYLVAKRVLLEVHFCSEQKPEIATLNTALRSQISSLTVLRILGGRSCMAKTCQDCLLMFSCLSENQMLSLENTVAQTRWRPTSPLPSQVLTQGPEARAAE